jgi:uncharacterized protein (TIGR03435 family)
VPAEDFHRAAITLRYLIVYAFEMPDFRVLGGPSWASTAEWQVTAKAATSTSPAETRQMVRRFLEERFALKTHLERRELPTYELVTARADQRLGVGIRPSATDCTAFRNGVRPMRESPVDPNTGVSRCALTLSMRDGVVEPRLNDYSLGQLARYLQSDVGRVIVDKTGISGQFDIALSYLDPNVAITPAAEPPTAPALASKRRSMCTSTDDRPFRFW